VNEATKQEDREKERETEEATKQEDREKERETEMKNIYYITHIR
jgi:hypothetical protein